MIERLGILLVVLSMLLMGCLAAENVTATAGINTSNLSVMGVIIVPQVVSDGPGWIQVRKDLNESGPIIGLTRVESGIHKNVPVFIHPNNIRESVFVDQHLDKGAIGVFEPNGPDKLVEGPLMDSFRLENSWGNREWDWWGNGDGRWGEGVNVILGGGSDPQENVILGGGSDPQDQDYH